jgi:hypothetical protein
MRNVSWAMRCKNGRVETQDSQKAKNKLMVAYEKEQLSKKELKELKELEKRGSRILSWARGNRKCKAIIGIVVADMLEIAPNAINEIESKMNNK